MRTSNSKSMKHTYAEIPDLIFRSAWHLSHGVVLRASEWGAIAAYIQGVVLDAKGIDGEGRAQEIGYRNAAFRLVDGAAASDASPGGGAELSGCGRWTRYIRERNGGKLHSRCNQEGKNVLQQVPDAFFVELHP